MQQRFLAILSLLAPLALAACSPAPAPAREAPPLSTEKLAPASVGSIERLNLCDGIYLASQPSPADFRKLQESGVRSVINLRPAGENRDFDEPQLMSELGLRYVSVPFARPDELTDTVFAKARDMLSRAQKPILLHCHSGNRVGAVWLAYRVLDDGLSYDAALAEAREVGLKAPALESKARDYVERERAAGR